MGIGRARNDATSPGGGCLGAPAVIQKRCDVESGAIQRGRERGQSWLPQKAAPIGRTCRRQMNKRS